MAKKLTDDEIVGRVSLGTRHMRKYVAQDRNACSRYRDPSTVPQWIDHDEDEPANMEGDEVAAQTTIGQPNQLTVNIMTKEAAITINDPDWVITADDVNVQKIGRQYLKQLWKNGHWKRKMRKAALKRWVGGLGLVSYRWDSILGPTGDHIQTWNFAVDPHHNDWLDLRWAAWRIKMPLREARARYPNKSSIFPQPNDRTSEVETSLDADRIFVWLYFSKDQTYEKGEEVHILGDRFGVQKEVLFRDRNLYERVPLLVMQGDIDPGPSEFPLSDHMLAAGLQAELSDMNQLLSNKARHGGPRSFYTASKFSKPALEALESPMQQGWIPLKGIIQADQPPAWRLAGEPIEQAEIEAKREAQQALDAATGVTQYQRGVLQNNTRFATEAALLANQSGARAIKERCEYEDFVNSWAETMVSLQKKFGGKRNDRPIPDEQQVLWESLAAIQEVRVIESSTTYKDPSLQQQQALQLYNTEMQGMQLWMAIAAMGITDKIPNLTVARDRMNRAFEITQIDETWTTAPQGQPGGQQQGKSPKELIDYKDAPPDIRRQMEQQAGMQPSQQEDASPAQAKALGTGQTSNNPMQQMVLQQHQHRHELVSQLLKQHHEQTLKNIEAETQKEALKHAARSGSNGSK